MIKHRKYRSSEYFFLCTKPQESSTGTIIFYPMGKTSMLLLHFLFLINERLIFFKTSKGSVFFHWTQPLDDLKNDPIVPFRIGFFFSLNYLHALLAYGVQVLNIIFFLILNRTKQFFFPKMNDTSCSFLTNTKVHF